MNGCVDLLQSQFRFDNECNLNLPDNHRRVSEWGDVEAECDPPALPPLPSDEPIRMTRQLLRLVSMLDCAFYI